MSRSAPRRPPVERVRHAWWKRQRQRPPICPPGWRIGPPDFVGVGTNKSGTSWWYRLIADHPDVITFGHPKELEYFRRFEDAFTTADAAAYARWFPRPRRSVALTGEWTPRYGVDPRTPPRLALAAPAAKLLLSVRDPIDRYRSDATMLRRLGFTDPEGYAVSRGFYGNEVGLLLDAFPIEQILFLQYERCVADPRAELARTFRFLGLDDSYVPRRVQRPINATREQKLVLPPERERELVRLFEPEVEELHQHMPDLDLTLWPSVRHLS